MGGPLNRSFADLHDTTVVVGPQGAVYPTPSYMATMDKSEGVGIAVGIAVGVPIGLMLDNIVAGIGIGLAIGIASGLIAKR
jgi:hypothetical protein